MLSPDAALRRPLTSTNWVARFSTNTVTLTLALTLSKYAGTLVSTCFFQLWLGALTLGAVLVPLLHPDFWVFVRAHIGWPISIAAILCWHIVSQVFLNRFVTDGKRIRWPFVWLFAYVALSSAYCVVRPAPCHANHSPSPFAATYACLPCASAGGSCSHGTYPVSPHHHLSFNRTPCCHSDPHHCFLPC